MNNQNWDDFRYILSVAETGSLNATAKALGVTHVTVMRRIAAFEARYGQPLFHKSPGGYRPLPGAANILEVAKNVEDAVLSVERTIAGAQESISGTVRIASTDSVCEVLLPDVVTTISTTYPALNVTVLRGNAHHDLTRLTADIAIRPAKKLGADLMGDKAGEVEFKTYAVSSDVQGWLGLTGSLSGSVAAEWIANHVPDRMISHRADSFLALREMAAKGLGKVLMPAFLGCRDHRLVELEAGPDIPAAPLWVASQTEMYQNPRISAVRDILVAELAKALAA